MNFIFNTSHSSCGEISKVISWCDLTYNPYRAYPYSEIVFKEYCMCKIFKYSRNSKGKIWSRPRKEFSNTIFNTRQYSIKVKEMKNYCHWNIFGSILLSHKDSRQFLFVVVYLISTCTCLIKLLFFERSCCRYYTYLNNQKI